jgi:uncharacterized YccA/Bax inhibitor family protein
MNTAAKKQHSRRIRGTAMPLIKTSNPALGENTFRNATARFGRTIDAAGSMTLNGTINKTGILLLCVVATACWTWHLYVQTRSITDIAPLMILGLFGGLGFGLATAFKMNWSPITAPIYALCEGLLLGGITALSDVRYPGIGAQAVGLTFATLFVMLFLYRSGIIKVTDKLRMGIVAATGGIALFYLVTMVLQMFHIQMLSSVFGSGPIGIAFSLFVVGIAALNLVLDFDFIERGVQYGAPKFMEWYGAFGIVVTLVWLYMEILRLLSKLRSRN